MDNFRYNEAAMAEIIAELKNIKDSMDSLSSNVKSILKDKLLAEGITGSTADVLIESFDQEVVKPILGYSDVSEAFITQNEMVKQLADETSQRNQQIASM